MYVLRHGKFISGSRIYRSGDILPDTAVTQELVKRRLAEQLIEDGGKKSKSSKKSESEQSKSTSENAESDS